MKQSNAYTYKHISKQYPSLGARPTRSAQQAEKVLSFLNLSFLQLLTVDETHVESRTCSAILVESLSRLRPRANSTRAACSPPSVPWAGIRGRWRIRCRTPRRVARGTANLRTTILDFRGFESNIILISRGGILMSMGNSPESSSQQMFVGIIFVGRLGTGRRSVCCTRYWDQGAP